MDEVRFGSLAVATMDDDRVRFTPESGRRDRPQPRSFGPKADIRCCLAEIFTQTKDRLAAVSPKSNPLTFIRRLIWLSAYAARADLSRRDHRQRAGGRQEVEWRRPRWEFEK